MAKQAVLNPGMGARGKARRLKLGIDRNDMAARLDVSVNRLHQMEQDGVDGLSTVTRWADALGMPAIELAFGIAKKGTKS
jgi:transcriptional regulator with XRE-family HTH domain